MVKEWHAVKVVLEQDKSNASFALQLHGKYLIIEKYLHSINYKNCFLKNERILETVLVYDNY